MQLAPKPRLGGTGESVVVSSPVAALGGKRDEQEQQEQQERQRRQKLRRRLLPLISSD